MVCKTPRMPEGFPSMEGMELTICLPLPRPSVIPFPVLYLPSSYQNPRNPITYCKYIVVYSMTKYNRSAFRVKNTFCK